MSVVIAVKTKNGMVIGGDKQGTLRGMKNDNMTKVFKSHYSNTAWGGVGKCRFLQVMSTSVEDLMLYKDILDKVEVDERYVITKIIPKVQDVLISVGELAPKTAFELDGSSMLVVTDKEIYHIGEDGSVGTYTDFIAIGCGSDLAIGYLENAWNKDLTLEQGEELVKNAIINSCKKDVFINDRVDIIKLEGKNKNGTRK